MKTLQPLHLLIAVLLVTLLSCNVNNNNGDTLSNPTDSIIPEYAKGFTVDCYDGYKVINIFDPFTTNKVNKIYVSKNDISNISKTYIKVPLSSVVCTSATHITFIDTLSSVNIVKGVSDIDYIFNPKIQTRYKAGEVVETSQGMNIVIEKVLAINPSAMLVSPFKEMSFSKLEEAGVNIIPIGDYLEPHPLGRLEWIKIMGILLDKEAEATKIYEDARDRYLEAQKLTATLDSIPTIFDGLNTWGTWYISGGKSFMAYIYNDCGSNYVQSDNDEKGSIVVNYETLYSQCHSTRYWRVALDRQPNFTLKELLAEDPKLRNFQAINEGRVIFCNIRVNPLFERGIIEPDVILRDLIRALHPQLLPGYKPVYYTILK